MLAPFVFIVIFGKKKQKGGGKIPQVPGRCAPQKKTFGKKNQHGENDDHTLVLSLGGSIGECAETEKEGVE